MADERSPVQVCTLLSACVIGWVLSPAATIAMGEIKSALDFVVPKLSDENYEESFTFYRLWFDIGQTYRQIPSNFTFDAIFNNRGTGSIKAELAVNSSTRTPT